MNMEDLLTCDFTMNEFRPFLYLGIYQNFKNSWPEDPQLF